MHNNNDFYDRMYHSQSDNRDAKLEDITNTVVRILYSSCTDCDITSDIIDMELFACFSESHVTYRARLQGTSETESSSLISLIEKWVDNNPNIGIAGLLMKVDSKCSVEISSFNEGECSETPKTVPDPTPSPKSNIDSTPGANAGPTDSTSDSAGNTVSPGAIIGGIVAVLVILIIALSLIIVVVLILKYRRGDPKKIK